MKDLVYSYSIAEIKEKVAQVSLKCTPQRIAIYEALLSSDHPNVEDIHAAIEKKYPSISLSTVYNTLEIFAEKKLIERIKTSNGKMRYDVRIEPHAHLVCTRTDQIVDYFDADLQKKISRHFTGRKINNFKYSDVHILISGELQQQKSK